jgi:hypothetical protein
MNWPFLPKKEADPQHSVSDKNIDPVAADLSIPAAFGFKTGNSGAFREDKDFERASRILPSGCPSWADRERGAYFATVRPLGAVVFLDLHVAAFFALWISAI